MNRILFADGEIGPDQCVTLTDRRARHIHAVLKPAVGQALRVGLLNGPRGTGTVVACEAARVTLACAFTEAAPVLPDISLLLALPRPKVTRRLWAPLASLGVARIILANAARVERNYFDTHWLDPAHYRPLLIEGLEQAGLTRVPEVAVCKQLKPFVEDDLDRLFPNALRLLAHPAAPRRMGDTALAPSRPVLIAIGPEGGWIPYELELLERHGFTGVCTGTEPLRSDVACIALVALARERLATPIAMDAARPHA